MDYQPMNQPMDQNSSNKMWYIVGVVVIAVLALWYFNSTQVPTTGTPTAEPQTSSLSPGNTTADITNDLNQTSDGSAALNADAAASAQAVSGF